MCQFERHCRDNLESVWSVLSWSLLSACAKIAEGSARKVSVGDRLKNWQIGFKMFLNITPTVTNWSSDNKQFSLIFEENPLADFVELPDDGRAQDELWYSNILCGVLRGALEMVCLPSHHLLATLDQIFPSLFPGLH